MIQADTQAGIKYSIIGVKSSKEFGKKLKNLEKQGKAKEISWQEFTEILKQEWNEND